MSTVYIVGIIILAVMFSGGVGAWVYERSHPEITASPPDRSPEYLEAMREVDAMLPGTTPITPRIRGARRSFAEIPGNWDYDSVRAMKYAELRHDDAGDFFLLEDGTMIDRLTYDADPKKAQARAMLAHLRSIGVPI